MKVKILGSIVLALALITAGVAEARGSFSSGGSRSSSSSSSSSRSSSSSSYSSKSYASTPSRSYAPSVARPSTASPTFAARPSASGATAPKSTASSGGFFSRPSASAGQPSRGSFFSGRSYSTGPGGVTVIHEHHYFGGYGSSYYGRPGYYGGYSGGFGSSPFFWLWLLDRPSQQAPIIVQQPAQVVQGVPSSTPVVQEQIVHEGPGVFMTIVNVLLGLLMLVVIIGLVVWIVRKLIGINKADHTV